MSVGWTDTKNGLPYSGSELVLGLRKHSCLWYLWRPVGRADRAAQWERTDDESIAAQVRGTLLVGTARGNGYDLEVLAVAISKGHTE